MTTIIITTTSKIDLYLGELSFLCSEFQRAHSTLAQMYQRVKGSRSQVYRQKKGHLKAGWGFVEE